MYIFSVIVAAVLAGILFKIHVDLHKENDCHMTYMWRYISLIVSLVLHSIWVENCDKSCAFQPIVVEANDVPGYGLYRYMEGFVNEQTM